MHDRLFEPGHFGKILVDMELKDIAGKPVDQGLIFSRFSFNHKIRIPLGKFNFFGGSVLSAKADVQARKNGNNAGEQFIAVGVMSFKFGNDQRPFILALVNVLLDKIEKRKWLLWLAAPLVFYFAL